MDRTQIPYDLISKHLCLETTPEEDESFFDWLGSDPDHVRVFEEIVSLYHGGTLRDVDFDVEARLHAIKASSKIENVTYALLWKIAAVLLIFFMAAMYWFEGDTMRTIRTRSGEKRMIVLPDSTRVWLNGLTTIAYDEEMFLTNRKVCIEGEGFFEIENGSTLFQIEYDSVVLSATKGQVNVQSYRFLSEKTVTVSDGVISFADLRKSNFLLTATGGEEVISLRDYGLLSISTSVNINFRAWITDEYAFDDTSVDEVLELITKGNLTETPSMPDSIRYQRVTGIYQFRHNAQAMNEFLTQVIGQPFQR